MVLGCRWVGAGLLLGVWRVLLSLCAQVLQQQPLIDEFTHALDLLLHVTEQRPLRNGAGGHTMIYLIR